MRCKNDEQSDILAVISCDMRTDHRMISIRLSCLSYLHYNITPGFYLTRSTPAMHTYAHKVTPQKDLTKNYSTFYY